jgi:hypothetical protein
MVNIHVYTTYKNADDWGMVSYYILAGGIPTPLKNMSSSVGMMKFPT